MDLLGQYETKTFPKSRLSTMDTCHIGLGKHYMQALVEMDVTLARVKLRERSKQGSPVSLTAWLLHCIAAVCAEYPAIHAVRKGRRQVVTFRDVDISLLVEREVHGERVPLPYVIRKAECKSIPDICREIRDAQSMPVAGEKDYVLQGRHGTKVMQLYYLLPAFLRRYFLVSILRNPLSIKREMGTVVVTSLGMVGAFHGWFVPIGIHPLVFAVGAITKKPGVSEGKIEIRDYLAITVLVDHDAVDGAPAARSLARLTEMLERAEGLDEAEL